MKKLATNQFIDGLVTDFHPLTAKNTTLTSALNATLVTTKGNEMVLQNDVGNVKILYTEDGKQEFVKLKDGFIPVGIKEYGGIIYIASYNPKYNTGEIGSFPSYDLQLKIKFAKDSSETQYDKWYYYIEKPVRTTLLKKYSPLLNFIPISTFDFGNSPKFIKVDSLEDFPPLVSATYEVSSTDFTTGKLNFDLMHPVSIEVLSSYDDSVNLILTDDKNPPRLINSGFSVLENNQVEFSNRRENWDNVYNSRDFELETSLIKRTSSFPKISYEGILNSGNLKVGNYTIYLKYSDDDGNETDFIALSGMISIFKGNDSDPFSIDGGVEDMNAYKSIHIKINNIDTAYNNIKVYFTRTSSAIDSTRIPLAYLVDKLFLVESVLENIINVITGVYNTRTTDIILTGDENIIQVPLSEITTLYFVASAAKTLAQCQNMLFLGNVETAEVDYTNLINVSQRIYVEGVRTESKDKIGWVEPRDYSNGLVPLLGGYSFEYYNTKNIYYNVGYWNEEFYRLGIVYILEDNTKTPVFNILGGILNNDLTDPNRLIIDGISSVDTTIDPTACKFDPLNLNKDPDYLDVAKHLNVRGVILINDTQDGLPPVNEDGTPYNSEIVGTPYYANDLKTYLYGLKVIIPDSVLTYLKSKGIKGYIIVRQKRIPTIIALGYTLPWDKESKVPIVTYYGNKRLGTADVMESITASTLELDYHKSYLFVPKRRYFVESFLKLAGEESGKEDSDLELFPSKVDNTYYSRLHYILDFMIDSLMVGVSFEGQKNIITNANTVPTCSFYTIFNENQDYWAQIENVYDEFRNMLSMHYPNLSMDDAVRLAAAEDIEFMSSQGHPLYFSYKKARNLYLLAFDTPSFNIYVVSTYEYSDSALYEIKTCGKGSDPRGRVWQSIPIGDPSDDSGMVYPYSPDPDLDSNYSEEFYYEYYVTDMAITNSGTVATLDEVVAILNAVIDSLLNQEGLEVILHYRIIRRLLNDKATSLNSFELSSMGKDDWVVVTNKIDPSAKSIPINRIGGYVGLTYNKTIQYMLQLAPLDDYSLLRPSEDVLEDQLVTYYFLNGRFVNDSRKSAEDYDVPVYIILHYYNLYKYCNGKQLTAICPEFEVRLPYFNTVFTGTKYKARYTRYLPGYLLNNASSIRLFYTGGVNDNNAKLLYDTDLRTFNVVSVTDNVPIVAINNTIFKSVIGSDAEAYRFAYINEEHAPYRHAYQKKGKGVEDKYRNHLNNQDFNLVRGIYSPYLGIESDVVEFRSDCYANNEVRGVYNLCKIFNLYYPGTFTDDNKVNYLSIFTNRFKDGSGYYAISDIQNIDDDIEDLYRGDCFLCTFTHRVNRNFNDPTSPTNDHILDAKTWHKNYYPDTTASNDKDKGIERLNLINRGDINAVKLGSWITIKIRSSYNLSIRSLDESHIQEKGIMGRARGFYPLQQASADGGFKIPNSYVINDAFGATLSEQIHEGLQDFPYINTNYADRVAYSNLDITGAFKNGYRIFRGTNYRDFTKQYGSITKLVERSGDLVCVFEHGVALLKINEKAIGAESDGGFAYLTANTVLPETPFIYTDMYGSQWPESVIKTPTGNIYGIDAVRKKIWKLDRNFNIISDFRIEKFLVDNLTLGETDSIPYLGLKNIATHYNANKSDVMFTFYYKPITIVEDVDNCGNIIGHHTEGVAAETEIAWNVCYNEILDKFQTFYSWIPLASANIDNQFYSFDRECSREIITENLEARLAEEIPQTDNRTPIQKHVPEHIPYLWKHGEDSDNFPLPTHWYDELHPFEFEFIVNEEVGVQKIFNNLVIISNKAEPESFHFTINGDGYDFDSDKVNMYYRLEKTKELFRNLGSHINFDTLVELLKSKLNLNIKSNILPLYYNRAKIDNDIYDYYTMMLDKTNSRDYSELSGSEIIWDKTLNEFLISTHIKNLPVNEYSYLRGNSWYKEDRWNILIPSITIMQKNEDAWDEVPPIIINPDVLAEDLEEYVINSSGLPNTYTMGDINTTKWTFRKEAKIRDKYCKIKIRYDGTKLAVISAIITTFTISYA